MERDSSLIFILTFFHHICLKFHFWFYYEAEKNNYDSITFDLAWVPASTGNYILLPQRSASWEGIVPYMLKFDQNMLRAVTVLVAMFTFSSRNWTTFYLNFTFSCNYFKTFFFTKYFNYMIRVKWYLWNPDSSSS